MMFSRDTKNGRLGYQVPKTPRGVLGSWNSRPPWVLGTKIQEGVGTQDQVIQKILQLSKNNWECSVSVGGTRSNLSR